MPLGYEHLTSVPRVISDRAKVDQARNKVGRIGACIFSVLQR